MRSGLTRCFSDSNHDLIASPCSGKNPSRNDFTSICALAAFTRKSAAEALASASLSPAPLKTTQTTSRQMPSSSRLRIVPPTPISMSSECAPKQRTDKCSPGDVRRKAFMGHRDTNPVGEATAFRHASPSFQATAGLSAYPLHTKTVFLGHKTAVFHQSIERLRRKNKIASVFRRRMEVAQPSRKNSRS
jgi:hypothetical protein